MKNIIISSFKESFKLVKKNKGLIILLFLLQLIFVVVFSALTVNYSFNVKEKTDAIFEYLAKQDFSDEGVDMGIIQENLLGDDPLMIHRNYVQIINYVKLLFMYVFLSYIIVGGLLWDFSDSLISKKKVRDFFVYWGKFGIISAIYVVLIGLLFYNTIKSFAGAIIGESFFNFNFVGLFLLIVLLYFMYISLALTGKEKLKDIPKKTFFVGIKKIHIMLLVYLVNIFVIALFVLIAGLTVGLHMVIMALANVLFVISLVWTRLFLVLVVDKLEIKN